MGFVGKGYKVQVGTARERLRPPVDWRLAIGDCQLVISQDPIENRQLEIGNITGRYRSRTVPSGIDSSANRH
jgi:hypothetical protein